MGSSVLSASLSNQGRVRPTNQDACDHVQVGSRHLFVTADGMGNDVGGSIASETVVKVFSEFFRNRPDAEPVNFFNGAFSQANTRILQIQEAKKELTGMGSTVVAVILDDRHYWFAHVGDSRLYLIRDAKISQLTTDHTLVQQMVIGGLVSAEEAKSHPKRHVLNRALGREPDVLPEINPAPAELREGDFLVLCTDGVTDLVADSEIEQYTVEFGPGRGIQRIIDLANSRGGHDNITAQIAYRGKPRVSWSEATLSPGADTDRGLRTGSRVVRWAAAIVVSFSAVAIGGWWALQNKIEPESAEQPREKIAVVSPGQPESPQGKSPPYSEDPAPAGFSEWQEPPHNTASKGPTQIPPPGAQLRAVGSDHQTIARKPNENGSTSRSKTFPDIPQEEANEAESTEARLQSETTIVPSSSRLLDEGKLIPALDEALTDEQATPAPVSKENQELDSSSADLIEDPSRHDDQDIGKRRQLIQVKLDEANLARKMMHYHEAIAIYDELLAMEGMSPTMASKIRGLREESGLLRGDATGGQQ